MCVFKANTHVWIVKKLIFFMERRKRMIMYCSWFLIRVLLFPYPNMHNDLKKKSLLGDEK
jgi:hypothetical protein